MVTKPLVHLYFALKNPTNEFVGWDAVDEDTISKYQQMLGTIDRRVFVLELNHPQRLLYEWNYSNGWTLCRNQELDFLPKEVRMRLLTGAI